MVYAGSILKVTDNTGARFARCIRVLGKAVGFPGDRIIVSIRAVVSGSAKVQKGEIYNGVIVRSRKGLIRECGLKVNFDDNAIVLLDKKGTPVGSRVLGPVAREVRDKGFKRVVALAMVTI